jgi:hypothetical protein
MALQFKSIGEACSYTYTVMVSKVLKNYLGPGI